MIGSILDIVTRLIYILDESLAAFVGSSQHYVFGRDIDGEWIVVQRPLPEFTEKGHAVVNDLTTIIHYGMDTLAQIVAAFPAPQSPPS